MDKSCPWDIMALGRDVYRLNTAMDIVIASDLTKLCLSTSYKSSDFILKVAETAKFGKGKMFVNPISSSSTMRFAPLALNHLGLEGSHFQAVLKEFATILVTKPEGCSLLHGPFALTHTRALHKNLWTWGSRLIWTAQREHASQLVRGMKSFYDSVAFVMQLEGWSGGWWLECLFRGR
jgi:hypothetical protein